MWRLRSSFRLGVFGAWVIARLAGGGVAAWLGGAGLLGQPTPVVEVEESVYTYEDARNGADPLWALGPTCLVRWQDRVFASGLQTQAGVAPGNNCRWVLFGRLPDDAAGSGQTSPWSLSRTELLGLTREPCPLGVSVKRDPKGDLKGDLFLSTHRLATGSGQAEPARFEIIQFATTNLLGDRLTLAPSWRGQGSLSEYSHRSLAVDGPRGELVLFLNGGTWGARWSYLDQQGIWTTAGELRWPWGSTYERAEPVRLTHASVLLRDRAVHYCGVSELNEPVSAWRDFKRQLTGNAPDVVSRRLFYVRSPDIERGQFEEWIEIANCDATAGTITPGDLWVDSGEVVHLVWTERTPDERLRERFFPQAAPSHAIRYARLRRGSVETRRILVEGATTEVAEKPSHPRFHITPDERLFVFYYVTSALPNGGVKSENRLLEIPPSGNPATPVTVPLVHPLSRFYTATPRAGSPLSNTLDLLGCRAGAPFTVSYARIRLR